MSRNHYEHDQQVALFTWRDLSLSRYPELKWLHSIPNGANGSARLGKWLKDEGKRAGIWDVFLPWPVQEWCGCYIEMKSHSKKLTPEQREFQQDNPKYYFAVAFDWIQATDAIIQYLAGERF